MKKWLALFLAFEAGAQASPYSSVPRLPDDMQAVAIRAAQDFNIDDYKDAEAEYRVIIQKYPDCLYAWTNLGVVYFQAGDLGASCRALEVGVKLNPKDAFCLLDLGMAYCGKGDYRAAATRLQRAVALKPNDGPAHNYLGMALLKLNRTREAQMEFERAAVIDAEEKSSERWETPGVPPTTTK